VKLYNELGSYNKQTYNKVTPNEYTSDLKILYYGLMYFAYTKSNASGLKYTLVYPYNLLTKLFLYNETNPLFKILAYPLLVKITFYGVISPWHEFYSYKKANDETKVSNKYHTSYSVYLSPDLYLALNSLNKSS